MYSSPLEKTEKKEEKERRNLFGDGGGEGWN